MKSILTIILLGAIHICISAQTDGNTSKLKFSGDYRFRAEQDWNSQKSDGSYREDRSRLRYRLRAGVTYRDTWYETGFRLRTGDPIKQQDPQLTLGDGFNEFSTLPIGLEKAYFQGRYNSNLFWIGKNTFPFKKNNELFWSDNVYPEGVFVSKGIDIKPSIIDSVDVRAGHFIMSTAGESLDKDAYFQGIQLYTELFQKRLTLFPSLYIFKNIPNIPDGYLSFVQDYKIFSIGSKVQLASEPQLTLEMDYSYNFENYEENQSVDTELRSEKTGFVIALQYNELKQNKDWLVKLSYAYLERFAALDYIAQNDWARWDYSSFESPDGRLTNLQGIEFVLGYKVSKKVNLKMKYYKVNQLLTYGVEKETGDRIRFDIDAKF